VARTVVVNPKITVLDRRKQAFWEGCLSIPNLRALVERPRKIRVDYLDLAGERRSIEAQGFLATVFQHELDHLAGVLFLDRVRDTTKIATLEEFQRHWLERSEPAEI
jgi:peptide deformylase